MRRSSHWIYTLPVWLILIGCDRSQESREPEVLPMGGVYVEEVSLDPAILIQLESPDQKRIEDFVSSIRVPEVEFSQSDLSEALRAIQYKAAEHSASRQGFSIIVEGGAAGPAPDPFGFDKDHEGTSWVHSKEHPFSGVYHDVLITTLLDDVTQHFSCWYEVTPYAVIIRPVSLPREVSRIAAFPVDQRFFGKEGDEGPLTAVDVLREHGFLFGGDGHAFHDEANARLIVKGKSREIERIGRLLQAIAGNQPD
ncbi:MAG: hypothetical protein JNJ70_04925 [Verrucomicrobiales bacterium]|nr:hypothetical protein [Verrucomicrobiales bacterium]